MAYQPPRQFPPKPTPAPPPGVPLVGQPVELLGWFPTVSFLCRCAMPPVPLLLCGLGAAIRCHACGTHWGVTRVGFDATSPESQLTISRVGRSDAPPRPEPPASAIEG